MSGGVGLDAFRDAAVAGTAESPGLIASGRERLHLNLTAARGQVTIDASSEPAKALPRCQGIQ